MKLKYFLAFASLVAMNTIKSDIILCDLGGTFVDTNKASYTRQELGIFTVLAHGLTNGLKFNPQQKMFATLDKIDPTPQAETTTHGNVRLPKIHKDWMAGKYEDPIATHNMILDKIDQFYQEDYYNSYFEYKVVRGAINAMFDPVKLASHQYALENMMALLERIDATQHTLAIVSNWDQHSFPEFLANNAAGQRIAKLFKPENMIISGYIKAVKPNTEFYQEIFKKYGDDNKEKYLFIDNEPVIIEAAKQHGIPAVHYAGDHKAVEAELLRRGIIKPLT